jgi:NADPH:quinone reductase-like Zn-dependent oxidoreductase
VDSAHSSATLHHAEHGLALAGALVGLAAAGDLSVVIDRVYDLAGAAKAHEHVDTGHKVGNVILRP